MLNPEAHPDFWQPVIEAAIAAAKGNARSQHAMCGVLEDLRGAGWASLADTLADLVADPGAFVSPHDLQHAEQVILRRTVDGLGRG